jgi:hypothetical protein
VEGTAPGVLLIVNTTPANLATQNSSDTSVPERVSVWVWAFRVVRWSTYLAAFITIILVLRKEPPPPIQISPQAAARAEAKVQQVEQNASKGEPAILRLDEAELNSMLAARLAQAQSARVAPVAPVSGVPTPATPDIPSANDVEQMRSNVRDVKVQMEGDLVKAYVVFNVHGKDMTLDLEGHLGAADGYLKFIPVSGQIGSMPVPQSALESAVQRLMESPENREKLRLPPDVADLHIVNGELVTTYH